MKTRYRLMNPRSDGARALYVFTLLFLLYLFDYMDRLVVTSLFLFIKADWGLSDAQCGMLVSAVYCHRRVHVSSLNHGDAGAVKP